MGWCCPFYRPGSEGTFKGLNMDSQARRSGRRWRAGLKANVGAGDSLPNTGVATSCLSPPVICTGTADAGVERRTPRERPGVGRPRAPRPRSFTCVWYLKGGTSRVERLQSPAGGRRLAETRGWGIERRPIDGGCRFASTTGDVADRSDVAAE